MAGNVSTHSKLASGIDSGASIYASGDNDKISKTNEAGARTGMISEKLEFAFDPDEYELRKRLPHKYSTKKNDVYVTLKTDFKAQLGRCERLLESGWDEVVIHGLGSAVNRAINLSLQLKRRGAGSIDTDVNTSTVEVTDDLEPMMDHLDPQRYTRYVSAVHIRLFRPTVPLTQY